MEPTSETRTVEEWAKYCFRHGHHSLYTPLCISCTRAYCLQSVTEALERAAKAAEQWSAAFPEDIFLPPPLGEHGKTVDACAARAIRYAAKMIAEDIRALNQEEFVA